MFQRDVSAMLLYFDVAEEYAAYGPRYFVLYVLQFIKHTLTLCGRRTMFQY